MKELRGATDLAINGAAPAFSETLHVGRPNIGDRDALLARMGDILDRAWLTNNGPEVLELERRLAERMGVQECVAMCNGTIALEIAIRALELRGEVIVPSYTFVATAHALQWQQIKPVFADIDTATHNLDPEAVEAMITERTSGIIGVHLWGRPAPIEALSDIARQHRIKLLFDAAHAFGCTHGGRAIGNFGECEVFSFHATKVFNTFEGGAVCTNNKALADKMRLMRNFGFAGYDNVIHAGTNGKMSEVEAAMGLVNLSEVDGFIAINERNYRAYCEQLAAVPGLCCIAYPTAESNNFQYMIVEVADDCALSRDQIVAVLSAENVFARRYFWPACHRMSPYRELQPEAGRALPRTEFLAERVFSLPTGSSIGPAEVADICTILRRICDPAFGPVDLPATGADDVFPRRRSA